MVKGHVQDMRLRFGLVIEAQVPHVLTQSRLHLFSSRRLSFVLFCSVPFHSFPFQADQEMPEQMLACAYVSCLSSAACPLVPEQVLREAEYEGNSMAC